MVAGWIAPHGVVADMPAERLDLVRATNAAMQAAAERLVSHDSEAVILVAPHGFRAADCNTVSLCRHNAIDLGVWYPWRSDELRIESDVELATAVLEAAHRAGAPAVGLIYGATSDPIYPMDWSITAPMLYLREAGFTGSLVPVTFSGLPLESEWLFGQALAEAIGTSGKRVAIVASSDLSHLHSDEGPYGCDPIAPEFDATIERAVRAGDLRSLTRLDVDWVAKAAQDGLRSILILGGALDGLGFRAEVLAYEVLVYFGMLTAVYVRE